MSLKKGLCLSCIEIHVYIGTMYMYLHAMGMITGGTLLICFFMFPVVLQEVAHLT